MFRQYLSGNPVTVERVTQHVDEVGLSSVTAEEMIVGRLNLIHRARSSKDGISLPAAHEEFAELIADISVFPILVYSAEAEAIYRSFPPATLRIGPQDCRITAQSLAHDLVVVTRNVRDFERIGAPYEDWSR